MELNSNRTRSRRRAALLGLSLAVAAGGTVVVALIVSVALATYLASSGLHRLSFPKSVFDAFLGVAAIVGAIVGARSPALVYRLGVVRALALVFFLVFVLFAFEALAFLGIVTSA